MEKMPMIGGPAKKRSGPIFHRISTYAKKRGARYLIVRIVAICVFLYVGFHAAKYFVEVTGLRRHVDPHALLGYFHCSVESTEIRSFPCDFVPKPNVSDVLVVTFINAAWLPLVRNWICSAEKVGIKDKLYLISFEPNVCSKLPSDVQCYEHTAVDIQGTVFGEPDYQELVIERTRVILKLLNCGQRIALVDADITFLKNPLHYLDNQSHENDILFQADSSGVRAIDVVLPYVFRYICGGMIYMKANYATRYLWRAVLQYQTTFKWNDQAGLNICIRHFKQFVRWNNLDSDYFPNGRQYFYYKERSGNNMIVHANHLEGKDKIKRMIGSHIWCDEDYAMEICNDKNSTKCNSGAEECTMEFMEACKMYRH